MDCPRCNLRYNTTTRKPHIAHCGHTFCEACTSKLLQCPICYMPIERGKLALNHSLLQVLEQKKIMKDIDKFIKVCFVGESKVGKTSLINRLKGQQYKENTIPTIGYDFAFQDRLIDEMNIRFQLWDSAGQERYRAISPLHYKNSDIVVVVYDVTQDGKNNNVFTWYEEASKHCPENAIKVFVGNKIDLLDEINDKNFNPLDASSWKAIANEGIRNYQLSCKSYEGVEEFWSIMDENVRVILKRRPLKDPSLSLKESQTTRPPSELQKQRKKSIKKKKLTEMKKESIFPSSRETCHC